MKIRFLTAAVLTLTVLGGSTARAGILFDSLTGSTATRLQFVLTAGTLGDSFASGVTPSALSDVKFELYDGGSNPTGSVTATLYASNGISPTTAIATLGTVATSAITPGTYATEDFSGFAPITLTASTRYYILLSTSNGSFLEAVVTSNLTGPEVASEFNYSSGTAQSNVSAGGTFEMQVSTSVVPEPSSLVLCGIAGLSGLAYRARRRRLVLSL